MHASGIKVIFDIPGLPVPVRLHQKYPGVDIVNQDVRLHPATHYRADVSDPDCRRLVRQLAEKMLKRYAHNPAAVAVGYDNEVGSSPMSYSEGDRARFVGWIKKRYGTIAALNACAGAIASRDRWALTRRPIGITSRRPASTGRNRPISAGR